MPTRDSPASPRRPPKFDADAAAGRLLTAFGVVEIKSEARDSETFSLRVGDGPAGGRRAFTFDTFPIPFYFIYLPGAEAEAIESLVFGIQTAPYILVIDTGRKVVLVVRTWKKDPRGPFPAFATISDDARCAKIASFVKSRRLISGTYVRNNWTYDLGTVKAALEELLAFLAAKRLLRQSLTAQVVDATARGRKSRFGAPQPTWPGKVNRRD